MPFEDQQTVPASPSHDYHRRERTQLLDFALRGVEARGSALDVGCADGLAGAELLRRGFAEVWGVEPEPLPAARAALLLTKVIARPFPCLEVRGGAPFDLIVFADSLEHIIDTHAALAFAGDLLGQGGRIVLSLPNVSHYSVIKELMRGRWTYADTGLLDRTHVRFFTPLETRRHLARAGFAVIAEEPVMARPLRRCWNPLASSLQAIAPHLFVWQQYVVAARTAVAQ